FGFALDVGNRDWRFDRGGTWLGCAGDRRRVRRGELDEDLGKRVGLVDAGHLEARHLEKRHEGDDEVEARALSIEQLVETTRGSTRELVAKLLDALGDAHALERDLVIEADLGARQHLSERVEKAPYRRRCERRGAFGFGAGRPSQEDVAPERASF